MKKHEFFKGLDWDKLLHKQLKPPVMLSSEEGKVEEEEDNEEMQFLKQQESKFNDRDYTKEN